MDIFQKLCGIKDQDGRPIENSRLRAMYAQNLNIAWPSTIEGALLSIIGSIDTMMVGTLGPAAIAAVGLTNQPRMILLICAQALCVGTTALCARRKGADDRAAANSCLNQSLALVTVLGVIITLIGCFGAEPFMRIAGANEDTLEMSVAYFRIICMGLLLNCWSLCICAAMRAIGKTRVTMITNITANLVNVCLNYILINGKLGFPRMGVRGAAIATVCGTAVSCLMAASFVCRSGGYYRLALPKFDRATLKGLFSVGSSSIAESAFLRVGFLINSRLIAGVGTNAFAAYQIVSQVTSLSFTLGDGIATAGTSLVGQSLGAKRKDLARAHTYISRRISIFASIGLMLVIFLLRRQLALLFTTDEEIILGVTLSFYVVIVGMLPQNGRVVFSGCLRGAGDTRYVAMVALASVAVLRPILTYLFCYPLNSLLPGLHIAVMGPWIAFVIDAFLRNGLLLRRIRQGKWLDIRLS
ncbi:MAG: MATE family efflux transporter [Clostridia bacterium]|nr:MATE family efflux transporter [Clostridia bacterium]